jgi:hypothetical protein
MFLHKPEQQSVSSAQALPEDLQPTVVRGWQVLLQMPLQHWLASVQAVASGVHEGAHIPPTQLKLQQSTDVVQTAPVALQVPTVAVPPPVPAVTPPPVPAVVIPPVPAVGVPPVPAVGIPPVPAGPPPPPPKVWTPPKFCIKPVPPPPPLGAAPVPPVPAVVWLLEEHPRAAPNATINTAPVIFTIECID